MALLAVLASAVFAPQALAVPVTIQAEELGGGPIDAFRYLINVDNVGDPLDPDIYQHPGLKPMAANSPTVAQGDETNATVDLDPGKYLVTVLADGYKQWGQHFEVVDTDLLVTVELLPHPLPLGKLQISAFRDIQPMNIAPDAPEILAGPVEPGLAGFRVILHDRVGEVSVDYYNNPICTRYRKNGAGEFILDAEGNPIPIPGTGGDCLTDANGNVTIEQLPPDKYTIEVIPPDGSGWIQTTTIEGKQELDAWITEGDEGLNVEERVFEPLSVATAYWFGYVKRCAFGNANDICETNDDPGTGSITGRARNWVGWPPFELLVVGEPVHRPWVALTNIGGGDELVAVTRGNANGDFTISNVPAGLYQLAIWDEPLDYITRFMTVEVSAGEAVILDGDGDAEVAPSDTDGDVGVSRWFGWVSGSVFEDLDGNAIKEPGETGLAGIDLAMRYRDGSVKSGTFTNAQGYYEFAEEIGAIFKFNVMEVGFGRFARTGHSLHNELVSNHPDGDHDSDGTLNAADPDLTTEVIPGDLGGDLLLNQLTQESHRTDVDFGKRAYAADDPSTSAYDGENGGISGVVVHASTRNELDASLQGAEDYEPGLGGVPIRLWGLGDDGEPNTTDDVLLNEITTDEWSHPRSDHPDLPQSCDIRDVNGNILPEPTIPVGPNCIEVLMIANETKDGAYDGGWAIEEAFDTGITAGADADGDGTPNDQDPDPFPQLAWTSLGSLTPGDYVVQAVEPENFQIVKEEDVNVNDGDQFAPAITPPPCVGDMHTVDVLGVGTDGYPATATAPESTPVDNPTFAEGTLYTPAGGSPFEGQEKPLCTKKLVTLQDQQNAGVEFFLFAENGVEIPGRVFGLVADNVHFSIDPKAIFYGEERGIPGIPIGVRDYTGRLITTITSDEHGFYEVLLPSTSTINCPNPAGICPGMYEFIVNDPGDPDSPNPNFNPNYMSLSYTFDVWPGLMTPADTALDPVSGLSCNLAQDDGGGEGEGESNFGPYPEFFSVNQPYADNGSAFELTINGTRLGAAQGSGEVNLGGVPLAVSSWSDTQIVATVPAGLTAGPRQLLVTTGDGRTVRNGVTFRVLGAGYNPDLVHVNNADGVDPTVGSGTEADPYQTVQAGINGADPGDLVIVHPGTYNESAIMSEKIKLQGYGPGGLLGTTLGEILPDDPRTHVAGSVISAKFFPVLPDAQAAWEALLDTITADDVPAGAAITVVGNFGASPDVFNAQIDGFGINQGRALGSGGIQVHTNADFLEITNNMLEGNSGQLGGGAIALGRAYTGDSSNDGVEIRYNSVLGNGGLHRAGAIGVFAGADNYEIERNFFCANFSGEYGGAISHFGTSNGGHIADNKFYANEAFDEGGAILVGGELGIPANPGDPPPLGTPSGAVDIERNVVHSNLSNDDGGGIRLLAPLTSEVNIRNNIIVDNVATDSGGGIALDDASNVAIVNNTLAYNATTDTAEDADGLPSGAGLSSEGHSTQFQASLPAGSPTFSDPVLFNNVFWANRALTPSPGAPAIGVGQVRTTGDFADGGCVDFEVVGSAGTFSPSYSILSTAYSGGGPGNIVGPDCSDEANQNYPQFLDIAPYLIQLPLTRLSPGERIVEINLERGPGHIMRDGLPGDLHITNLSPAVDVGTALFDSVPAPLDDIDSETRPMGASFDMGADELTGDVPLPVGEDELEPPEVQDEDEGGEGAVGELLAATAGGWTGTPPFAFAFQWQRSNIAGTSWTDIPGATGSTYTVTAADTGLKLRVVVSASNAGGLYEAVATSGPLPVAGVPQAPPSVSAASAAVRRHTITFRATSQNCSPCQAEVRLKYRGHWHTYRMSAAPGPAVASETSRWIKTVRNVPSGRWQWQVRITDLDRAMKATSSAKWVRVR